MMGENKDYYKELEAKGIPVRMREAVVQYIMYGQETGSFLMAVFRNDLKEAVSRADGENQMKLPNYVSFMFNVAPMGCWGSPESVEDWMKDGGLEGIMRSQLKQIWCGDRKEIKMQDIEGVFFNGPHSEVGYGGDEVPKWYVYLGDEEGEPVDYMANFWKFDDYESASDFAWGLSKRYKVELVEEALRKV